MGHVAARQELGGSSPLLLLCAFWELNSGHQVWLQSPLPPELSCQPKTIYLISLPTGYFLSDNFILIMKYGMSCDYIIQLLYSFSIPTTHQFYSVSIVCEQSLYFCLYTLYCTLFTIQCLLYIYMKNVFYVDI